MADQARLGCKLVHPGLQEPRRSRPAPDYRVTHLGWARSLTRMADDATTTAPARLTSRPGRLALVVPDLSTLRGPTTGVVELSHRLVWLPAQDRRFDLDDQYDLLKVYEIVLREAVQVDELATWLDAATLRRLWPELILPRGVRRAWELRYPDLAGHRAAA